MVRVQLFVETDVAGVVQLAGVKVPAPDKSLSQHQGQAIGFWVWKEQTLPLYHRIASIAHLGGARQAIGFLP
jgi:hypothetical protein